MFLLCFEVVKEVGDTLLDVVPLLPYCGNVLAFRVFQVPVFVLTVPCRRAYLAHRTPHGYDIICVRGILKRYPPRLPVPKLYTVFIHHRYNVLVYVVGRIGATDDDLDVKTATVTFPLRKCCRHLAATSVANAGEYYRGHGTA